ncbi:MAG TPA: alpha/beta hydrolase, partial [Rhizobiales bacterium]|nr:alpha/beta hydrolase [Hyphomicrobiales bacterium]
MELASTGSLPVPEGLKAGTVQTADGCNLRYAITANGPTGRGTVCVFHGRRGYIERDYETVTDLLDRGFSVALLDWRGQGRSDHLLKDHRKGHIKSFRQYDADLEAFMKKVVLPDCPPPYYGLAHSTGGNVLLRALQKSTWFEACVLVAPMLGFRQTKISLAVLGTIINTLTAVGLGWLSFPGDFKERVFARNELTHDERRFEKQVELLADHPDLDLGPPTIGWLSASLAANKYLMGLKGEDIFHTPVLIIASGDERVVSQENIHKFARQAGNIPLVTV